MLQIEVEQFSIGELHECKVVEHVGSKLVLLLENELELGKELYLDAIVVCHVGYLGLVAGTRGELRLVWVQGVPSWCVLVTVLRVEKLRVHPVKVIDVITGDVGKAQEVDEFSGLLNYGVEVYAHLLGYRVLG